MHGRAHCRHLANTIELSVCGGDLVLCQITLTTCYGLPYVIGQAIYIFILSFVVVVVVVVMI